MPPKGPGPGPGGPGGRFMHPGAKAKNFTGTIKRLLGYLKTVRVAILIVLIFTILSTLFNTISPKLLGGFATSIQSTVIRRSLYNSVTGILGKIPEGLTGQEAINLLPESVTQNMTENIKNELLSMDFSAYPEIEYPYIGRIILTCLGLYALSAIFNFVQSFVLASITQKTVYRMRNEVKDKLNRLPISFYDKYTHGEILSRVTNDIDTISNTLQQSLAQILSSLVQVVAVLIMMLSISPILTLVTIFTLPVIILITTIVAKHSQKHFARNQAELGNINGHIEEMYTGHKIIAAYGREEAAIEKFDQINQRLYTAGWKSQFVSSLIMPLTHLVNNIGYLLICVLGGLLSTRGIIDLGGIVAFTQYSRQFTYPIVQVTNIFNILQATAAAAERVFEILDEPEERPDDEGAAEIADPKGYVEFKNVKFGYSPDKILINNMNIKVEPGQTIAIVGPTGAGKTTLVNLLMRFYEINGGQILIDGTDITKLKRSNLRGMFGMVLQDSWLFNGTIRDNIAYGREDATEEEIIQSAKIAYVDHFVCTLPKGYNTVINEEASNISHGQKQLITIARAVLSDPAILILDEATSNVDTRTELLIQKAMNKLMKGRTSFVIAHRLSTIKNADLILVMKQGDIIEQGTHSDLMKQNGFYAELYNSQFMGANNSQTA